MRAALFSRTREHPGDLQADTVKDGSPVLRDAITLLDGIEIRVKLFEPRAKKKNVT